MTTDRNREAPPAVAWPELTYPAWQETCETLHMWLQIVGKIRLTYSPWVNHQWHSTLYVTSRGLTTLPVPYGGESFQLDFDFFDHALTIAGSNGRVATVELGPRSVADFHQALMEELARLGMPVEIHGSPNEVTDPLPFARDEVHAAYDPAYVQRFFQVLASSARVLMEFRSRFIGKSSPVHFFWGAMDLAVTRFSGRRAPVHPGGMPNLPDRVTREAYSHEVSSAGFWPGSVAYPTPLFYSYAYPAPEGYAESRIQPAQVRWEPELSEFILPYEAVRTSSTPEADLMAFLQSTYEAAADLGDWARADLEWGPDGQPRTEVRRQ